MKRHQRGRRGSVYEWIGRRSLNGADNHSFNKGLDAPVYSAMKCVNSWNPSDVVDFDFGGIFNFDFSVDGSVVAAACEKMGLLMFDPINGKLIGSKERAHNDSINCIKFLDSRMFATCSDDTTVRIWDVRSMKRKVMTLRGHSYWVKNIDYKNGMLFTSGFDGFINMWDINKIKSSSSDATSPSSSGNPMYQRVFQLNGLMRSRQSPDGSKLILATRCGYIMVIHDLNLDTLAADLRGFRPTLYHAVQLCHSTAGAMLGSVRHNRLNGVFTSRRNRVEIISDFPVNDKAEMIASVDVHPHGWSIASRNTCSTEQTEWTCVHDIQGTVKDVEWEDVTSDDDSPSPHTYRSPANPGSPERENSNNDHSSLRRLERSALSVRAMNFIATANVRPTNEDGMRPDQLPLFMAYFNRNVPDASGGSPDSSENNRVLDDDDLNRWLEDDDYDNDYESALYEIYIDSSSEEQSSSSERLAMAAGSSSQTNSDSSPDIADQESVESPQQSFSIDRDCNKKYSVLKNQLRLTHYTEEPNVGRGFIKEICFSQDGRLIASPFARGVRLLAFDPECREACDCRHNTPVKLHELTSLITHPGIVLTTKFSPTHNVLVSGCLQGKVCFHQPLL